MAMFDIYYEYLCVHVCDDGIFGNVHGYQRYELRVIHGCLKVMKSMIMSFYSMNELFICNVVADACVYYFENSYICIMLA